jgi:hypothetical protein
MNNRSCWFICVIVVIALCSFNVLADEPTLPREAGPVLIGRADPALTGVRTVVFRLAPAGDEPNEPTLWKKVTAEVTKQLSESGISWLKSRPGSAGPADLPDFTLAVDMLRLANSQQYVFRVQTSLAAWVCLKSDSSVCFKAELWKMTSPIQAVSQEGISTAIITEAVKQAEAFVLAYSAANQARPSANEPATNLPASAIGRKISPEAKPLPAEYHYVASKNSNVFHRPDCPSAGRISPDNLVGFTSRADAVKSGRRPCRRCKP